MKTESLPLPVTLSNKWRNMAFNKSGCSYRGIIIYDTQTDALAAINELELIVKAGNNVIASLDGELDPDQYAFAIALPC